MYWKNRCWLLILISLEDHCWVLNVEVLECKHSKMIPFKSCWKNSRPCGKCIGVKCVFWGTDWNAHRPCKVSTNSVQSESKLESTFILLTLASIRFNANLYYSWITSWVQRSKCNRHSTGLGLHKKTHEYTSITFTISISLSHTHLPVKGEIFITTYLCQCNCV
jgi:hypothetical protein